MNKIGPKYRLILPLFAAASLSMKTLVFLNTSSPGKTQYRMERAHMFDLPDLPLALIMEEILEWEKPTKEKQDGTSLNNFEDVSDKRKEVVNKIEHLSTTSFMERNK